MFLEVLREQQETPENGLQQGFGAIVFCMGALCCKDAKALGCSVYNNTSWKIKHVVAFTRKREIFVEQYGKWNNGTKTDFHLNDYV